VFDTDHMWRYYTNIYYITRETFVKCTDLAVTYWVLSTGFYVYSLLYNVIFNRTCLFDYMYICTVFYLFYFTMTTSISFDCILYGSMENE
jgi:hypothetical protein